MRRAARAQTAGSTSVCGRAGTGRSEGCGRQIGYQVSRLIRTGYGPIDLPRKLRRGKFQALTPGQVRLLYHAAGMSMPADVAATERKKRRKRKERKTYINTAILQVNLLTYFITVQVDALARDALTVRSEQIDVPRKHLVGSGQLVPVFRRVRLETHPGANGTRVDAVRPQ